LRVLKELKSAVKRLPGPTPSFNFIHAVMMILLLEEGPIGRKRLADLMDIGEGSVRSLIRRLREAGYLKVDRDGCYLTKKGLREVKELRKFLKGPVELDLRDLVRGKVTIFLVRVPYRLEFNVVDLRDEAVRAGGRGAIILASKGGHLFFPDTMEPLEKYKSTDESLIREAFHPSDGDILVIGLGESRTESNLAALAVSLAVLERTIQ